MRIQSTEQQFNSLFNNKYGVVKKMQSYPK